MLREQVFNSIKTGIIVIDIATKKIVDLNGAAAEIIGLEESDILGSPCNRYLCNNRVCDNCLFANEDVEEVENQEISLVNENGEKKCGLVSVTNICLDGRKLLVKSFIETNGQNKSEEVLSEEWSKAEKALSDNIYKLRNGNGA